jgi:hypothetical protein
MSLFAKPISRLFNRWWLKESYYDNETVFFSPLNIAMYEYHHCAYILTNPTFLSFLS